MQKLGIIIPTNQPKEFSTVMHDSIQYLIPMLKKVEVWFLFNFQPPWSPSHIKKVLAMCLGLGFGFRSLTTTHPKGEIVRMANLRNDAAKLLPHADWYMLSDDNLQFQRNGTTHYPGGSAARYLHVLDYMNTFPNCGTVMCEGSLGGFASKYSIRPTRVGLIATSRGLFFRNTGCLYTTTECAVKGSLEETFPAYRLMTQGLFIAKQFNNPTRHLHRHQFSDTSLPPTHITNYEHVIVPNGERYVRNLYADQEWTHEKRYIPDLVWGQYRAAGGDMDAFERPSKYWKDYDHR